MGSETLAVRYGYNGAGQLTLLTTPSGQVVGYSYANDRISAITVNGTSSLGQVTYEPFDHSGKHAHVHC